MVEVVDELGYKPIPAASGMEALARVRSSKVDIIISDLHMPQMSGTDLLQKLRDEGYQTPFIIQSGSNLIEKHKELIDLGVFDFLLKPAPYEAIQASLAKAARSLRHESEL